MALVEIVNNERDRKTFPVPIHAPDGTQARDAKGKLMEKLYTLGSTLDANAGEGVAKPRLRIDERLWDTLKDRPVFRGWLQAGNISVYNVRT